MNKFKFYFIASFALIVLFSCNKSDAVDYEILHDYGVQYTNDMSVIEDFLKGHYIESITDHPGFTDDQDIKISKITDAGSQVAIWDSPLLHSVDVPMHTMIYKVYYISAREGATDGLRPSRVDNVLVAYEGSYLRLGEDPTGFETVRYPNSFVGLNSVITGWSEIIPLFKTGHYNAGASEGGPAVYNDFGAGVMFIPSGLAYYNTSLTTIPAYAQLMFKFKLYDLKRSDQDADGILSNDEDLNHDGIFTNDDTDGDGIQNFLDTDDDGDGFLTKNEIKDINGVYYPFDLIPDCGGNNSDPARIKRHLDFNCHKTNQ